jgi:hypothetical protein
MRWKTGAGILLALMGLTGCGTPPPPQSAPALTSSPRQAGQRGLDYLLNSATYWQQNHRCFGCHVQGVAVMGAALARANDYTVNTSSVQELLQVIHHNQEESHNSPAHKGFWKSVFGQNNGAAINPYSFTSSYHAGIALAYHDRFAAGSVKTEMDQRARRFMAAQRGDGAYPEGRQEPPIDQGLIMSTTSCLVTLFQADPDDRNPEFVQSERKAIQWLRNEEPRTIQDYTYKIIGLTWRLQRDNSDVVARTAQGLIRLRQADGGWPESPGIAANAYATGLALYGLKLAGTPITDPVMVEGTLYLLKNQLPDGSWDLINTTSRRPSRFASTMYAVVGLGGVFDQKAEDEFLSLFRGTKGRSPISAVSVVLYLAFPVLTLMALKRRRW